MSRSAAMYAFDDGTLRERVTEPRNKIVSVPGLNCSAQHLRDALAWKFTQKAKKAADAS